jgi:hypothetical protein
MSKLVERVGRVVAQATYQRMPGDIVTCEGIGLAAIKEMFDWLAEPSEAVWEAGLNAHREGADHEDRWKAMLAAARKEAGIAEDDFIAIPRLT